jgi:ATP-dependent Clp protease protease subunit
MPYSGEHSCRQRNPGDFEQDSFRRKNITDGVDIIAGHLKGETTMTTQTYRLKADKFTAAEAKDWLKKNNVTCKSFEAATGSKNMESAILKIYGDIGEPNDENPDNISAALVSEFLDQHKDSKELIVKINSRGGDVQEGWAIYDLLTNSKKKIKTICEGKVYSIATIVFLAGSEREIMANADGLIHNPYIPGDNLSGDYRSSDLLTLAEHMAQEEEKILDFYVEGTGSPKEKLAEYMKEDTKLSAEDMLNLGFATKIIEPVKAYAYIKLNKIVMDEKDVKTWGEKLDTLIAKVSAFSRLTPIDQTLKDKDGKEFKLEKVTGSPAVGDKAAPDGTFVMADGKTIVIANGVVTEVKEPVAAKTELELANEKIVELTAKLADVEKVKVEAEVSKTESESEKVKAVALVKELSALKNSWKPDSRTRFSSAEKVGDIDLNQVRELKEKLNKKE